MAEKLQNSGFETFRLFQSSNDEPHSGGLGFLDASEKPLPLPPPCEEVHPSEVLGAVKCTLEPIILGNVTLVKGRVSTQDVFSLSNSDLVPGKYEGGLKLWEGSLDLVKAMDTEIQNGQLCLEGKRVLELGCGHGLPGIFACLKGAAAVHFQDFNAEVLKCLTIPNVSANLPDKDKSLAMNGVDGNMRPELRFFAGDWGELKHVLPCKHDDEQQNLASTDESKCGGYDVILMAETVYSLSALPSLYKLIKECINRSGGAVYMAAKKYYFGVGGGSRRFISIVEKDGVMLTSLIAEVTDGSSNVREVWKLSCK